MFLPYEAVVGLSVSMQLSQQSHLEIGTLKVTKTHSTYDKYIVAIHKNKNSQKTAAMGGT